ncbi:MAG: PDR/VanB family oxidoreductase [Sulfitobacter sp.]
MSAPQKAKAGPAQIDVIVSAVVPVTPLVTRFEFTRADGTAFPPFSGGAHTVVSMQDSDVTRLNPYSLMSDPADLSTYAISVRRDDEGRGGSLFMHTQVRPGDAMTITYPVNLFSLDLRAKKHLFFAGGIGITPFMSMIAQLEQAGGRWELHYTSRDAQTAAYGDMLKAKHPARVHPYDGSAGARLVIGDVLAGQPLGTHAYTCGPERLIDGVRDAALGLGWADTHLHAEEFLAPEPGAPFEVRLCKSDKTITVGADESLLEALEREGVDAPFLCRAGSCGQCETPVVAADGAFVHRDHWLEDEDRASGKKIMPCVSRFVGEMLEIDR